jgi:hypothetical protein
MVLTPKEHRMQNDPETDIAAGKPPLARRAPPPIGPPPKEPRKPKKQKPKTQPVKVDIGLREFMAEWRRLCLRNAAIGGVVVVAMFLGMIAAIVVPCLLSLLFS